ncbi:MAG: serine hydrolase, partial [Anaerolineae bacterium]|nr:serine hydrolase [Anaerolineae bacterium]
MNYKIDGRLPMVIVLALAMLAGCSALPGQDEAGLVGSTAGASMQADRLWPTEGWQVSAPEPQGMDGALLDQMMKFVDENRIAVDSVLVVRNGTLVFETYRNGYGADSRHHLQSATKSVTSALVGIALRDGLIASVDQTMVDFFH